MKAVLVILACVSLVSASTVKTAETVARSIPQSNPTAQIIHPEATVCSDGAVWLFWVQMIPFPVDLKVPWTADLLSSSRYGVFGSLVGPRGERIVPPTRILEPLVQTVGLSQIIPELIVPVAQPDGSVLVYMPKPRTYKEREIKGSYRPPEMLAISVTRKGEVNSIVLDGGVFGNRVGAERQMAAFWTWWTNGLQTCLFGGPSGLVHRCVLPSSDDWSQERAVQQAYYVAVGCRESSYSLVAENNRTALRWCRASWDQSAVIPLDTETVLVAYLPPTSHDRGAWGGLWPGDTLFAYRVRSGDLVSEDSVIRMADSVAGEDFPDVMLPFAHLGRTPKGFRLFVTRREGVSSYEFDQDGKPILGPRRAGSISTPTGYDGKGDQLMLFTRSPDAGAGWSVVWLGLNVSGGLAVDSRVTRR